MLDWYRYRNLLRWASLKLPSGVRWMLLVVMKIWHWKSFVLAERLLDANADLSHERYKRFIQSIAFPYLVFSPF